MRGPHQVRADLCTDSAVSVGRDSISGPQLPGGCMGHRGTTPFLPRFLDFSTLKQYHPELRRQISNKTTVLDAGKAQRTRTEHYLNITFPSTQRSPTYPVTSNFPDKISFLGICHVSQAPQIPLSSHILFGQTKNIWSTAHNLKTVIFTIRLHQPVTDPDLGCSILLIILFNFNLWTKLHINKTGYAPINA